MLEGLEPWAFREECPRYDPERQGWVVPLQEAEDGIDGIGILRVVLLEMPDAGATGARAECLPDLVDATAGEQPGGKHQGCVGLAYVMPAPSQ